MHGPADARSAGTHEIETYGVAVPRDLHQHLATEASAYRHCFPEANADLQVRLFAVGRSGRVGCHVRTTLRRSRAVIVSSHMAEELRTAIDNAFRKLRTFTAARRLVSAAPYSSYGPRVAALLAIVFVVLSSPAPAAADVPRSTRIGIVDSRALMREMPGRDVAESQFARELAGARDLVRAATESLQEAVNELARADDRMRPQQQEAAVMVIRARELALEDMVAQLNGLAQKRLAELQAPLRDRLTIAIGTVRKREKLSLVIDVADGGFVVDADEALNINPLVLAELSRSAPGETQ